MVLAGLNFLFRSPCLTTHYNKQRMSNLESLNSEGNIHTRSHTSNTTNHADRVPPRLDELAPVVRKRPDALQVLHQVVLVDVVHLPRRDEPVPGISWVQAL